MYDIALQAFKLLDQDGDGNISSEDLKYVLRGTLFSKQKVDSMLSECDMDANSYITREEFFDCLKDRLSVPMKLCTSDSVGSFDLELPDQDL